MILFFSPGGRLGNQLFQLAFIESLRGGREKVVVTQFSKVQHLLGRLHGYRIIDSRPVVNFVDHFVQPFIARFLVGWRVFGLAEENDDGFLRLRGLFPVTYVRGYFQQTRFLKSCLLPGAIRSRHMDRARRMCSEAEGRKPLFVHVRRGDYASWNHRGKSPMLPYSFYAAGIRNLMNALESSHFFFVGDDPQWCERMFSWVPHKTVSRLDMYQDLALMSLCAGGVISNSSFAIWGAALCKRSAPIIAPRYWFGWGIHQWFPRNIENPGFEYIDVPEEE